MLLVDLVFVFFAAIAFLGFIINALFYKLKIADILPLMLIGVLIGPVFNLVYIGPGSLAAQLAPYITAIAVAFILFDVGLNMKISRLSAVLARATLFTLAVEITTALVVAVFAYYGFGWTWLWAFIFGFAVAGPSSITVPRLMGMIEARSELKTTLTYESVASDVLQLIVPLILIGFIINPITNLYEIASFAFTNVVGSILIALLSALFWLYILSKYRQQSRSYSWMLTVAMIIATYGIADGLGLNGAITSFVFGLAFAAFGGLERLKSGSVLKANVFKRFFIRGGVRHIISYQREIVFVTSTFFFVYIGLLLNLSSITLYLVLAVAAITFIMVLLRFVFSPMLGKFFSTDTKQHNSMDKRVVYFDVARGISPIIIGVVLLTSGIDIPGLTIAIFLVVLFTNITSAAGIWTTYRDGGLKEPVAKSETKSAE